MKKRISMALAILFALSLSLVIPVGAIDMTPPEISDEQYQNYLDIAEQVGEERGISITVGDRDDMDRAYTNEEFEAEVEDFCDMIATLNSPEIAPYAYGDNPSAGGPGVKYLTVNSSKTLDGGYFLWSLTGVATVSSGSNYTLDSVRVASIEPVKKPSIQYAFRLLDGSSTSTISSNVKTVQRQVEITKETFLMTTVTFQAKFTLNTSTGSVTMTATSWT